MGIYDPLQYYFRSTARAPTNRRPSYSLNRGSALGHDEVVVKYPGENSTSMGVERLGTMKDTGQKPEPRGRANMTKNSYPHSEREPNGHISGHGGNIPGGETTTDRAKDTVQSSDSSPKP